MSFVLEYADSKQVKAALQELIFRHVDKSTYKAFIFGSRVDGSSHPRSDIDVGILGPKATSASVIAAIEDELEQLPYLYKIDLVDFMRASDRFRNEALKTLEYL